MLYKKLDWARAQKKLFSPLRRTRGDYCFSYGTHTITLTQLRSTATCRLNYHQSSKLSSSQKNFERVL